MAQPAAQQLRVGDAVSVTGGKYSGSIGEVAERGCTAQMVYIRLEQHGGPGQHAVVRINKTSVTVVPSTQNLRGGTDSDTDDAAASDSAGSGESDDEWVHLVVDAGPSPVMTPRAVPTTPRIVVTPSPRDPGNGASASPEDQEDQPPVPGHARRWITTTSVPAGLAERVEARRTELTATLRRVFDVAGFRALQLEAVVAMVDWHRGHSYIHLPTGAGKSLLFQMAALVSTGVTIVIVPLKALREQQVARAVQLGLTTVVLRGADDAVGTSRDTQFGRLDDLASGSMDGPALLFCTPEMLGTNGRVRSAVAALHDAGRIQRVVVDEDHVIPQCGPEFRPLYRELGALRQSLFPTTPVTAMSAIATPVECVGFLESFGLRAEEVHWFRGSFRNSMANVEYQLRRKDTGLDIPAVVDCIRNERRGAGIVYCLTCRDCDRVASGLREVGFKAESFHGKLAAAEKRHRLKRWEDGAVQILCGTDSIGMGIHKLDVRFVVHMSPPLSVAAHHQQCGRAGRDGAPARIWLLHHPADFAKGIQVVRFDKDKVAALREMHRHYLDGRCCRRMAVVTASGAPSDPSMICGVCNVCTADPSARVDITGAILAALVKATRGAGSVAVAEVDAISAMATALAAVASSSSSVPKELLFALKRFGAVRPASPHRTGWVSLGSEAELRAAIGSLTVQLDFGPGADVTAMQAAHDIAATAIMAATAPGIGELNSGNADDDADDDDNGDGDDDDDADFFSSASGDEYFGGGRQVNGGGDGPPTGPGTSPTGLFSPDAAASSSRVATADFVLQWIVHSAGSRHAMGPAAFRTVEPALRSRMALHRKIAILTNNIANMVGGDSPACPKGNWSLVDPAFVTYHATVERAASGGLCIVPCAPELDHTPKRFHSKYGADRFVHVSVPTAFWRAGQQLEPIARSDWHFAGRVYQLLMPQGECDGFALRFFAVSGPGIPTIPVAQVRDWHIPPTGNNATMTVAKYCSRFSLGFSAAKPTVVVLPEWIEIEEDPVSEDTGAVMTDGCCGISQQLLKEVCIAYGAECTAFQGRLGAAKGMFYLDDRLPGMRVTLRRSMVKYDIGHAATPEQLTIEVCSVVSKLTRPARFNTQMVRLLAARGVAAAFFLDAQAACFAPLHAALVEDAALEIVLTEHRGRPEAAAVRAALDAGFLPEGWLLRSLRRQLVAAVLAVHQADPVKLLLPEDASRCKILADPTGTLEPNQCYIRVPGGRGLLTGKVLLCRNPCYHPGELLLLDAICPTQGDQGPLQHLESTVVLSVRGCTPPAQHMQGGDYDGDEVMVIWNEEIVSQVTPFQPPQFAATSEPAMPTMANCVDVDAEMIRHWARSMHQANLGHLSKLHGKWADLAHDDWESSVSGQNAMELAELVFHQMDAWKSGFSLPQIPHHLSRPPLPQGRSIDEQLRNKHDAAIASLAEYDCGQPKLDDVLPSRPVGSDQALVVAVCRRELMDGYSRLRDRHWRSDDRARLKAETRLLVARVATRLFDPQLSKEEHMATAVGFLAAEVNEKKRRWDMHQNGARTQLSPLVHEVCGGLLNEYAESAYRYQGI